MLFSGVNENQTRATAFCSRGGRDATVSGVRDCKLWRTWEICVSQPGLNFFYFFFFKFGKRKLVVTLSEGQEGLSNSNTKTWTMSNKKKKQAYKGHVYVLELLTWRVSDDVITSVSAEQKAISPRWGTLLTGGLWMCKINIKSNTAAPWKPFPVALPVKAFRK